MQTLRALLGAIGVGLLVVTSLQAADPPCVSGPRVGQRPGPYSFVLCTGDNRGKSHCYICETEDRPAVILFARTTSEPLGKLASKLDRALADYSKNDLRVWLTLLHDDQSKIDADVVAWAKKHTLRGLPIGVFEDVDGPPSYRLHRDADVTVLLYVKQKVVVNRAFRAGELTDARIDELIKAIPQITGPARK
ncbi:MAG: hypothetical protein U0840_19535 [Gemmataceae bacterium]